MSVFTILKAVIGFALIIARMAERSRILKEGEALAIKSSLEVANARLIEAQSIRRASHLHSDAGGLRDENPDRRD